MKRFCIYTRLQLKRMAHYAPFVFLVTLVICLCLVIALVAVTTANKTDDQTKVKLGVVGDFNNSYMKLGISALKSFDSSRVFLEIEPIDEAEARARLFKGELAAYIVIPEDFVDNALYGDIGKLSFVTMDAGADIINMFKKEVLGLVSCLLVESQNGTFGYQNALIERSDLSYDEIYDMTNEMMFDYISLIVNRSNVIEVENVEVAESFSFSGYMFAAICSLLILLSGIVCCPLFIRRDYSLPKLMSANRYGVYTQTLGEYLSLFIVMAINTTVLLWIMMISAGKAANIIPEFAKMGNLDIAILPIKFLPAIALITALQYLLYQLSDSVVSGVLIQFVFSMFLGYASGCIYPIIYFPEGMQLVSGMLPSGIAREYLSSLIINSVSHRQIILIFVYTAILLVLSGLVRRRCIREA